MLAQSPDSESPRVPGPMDGKPPRNVGSRRIFPALFKLQVLDAYRHDHDCKGNQRATARKFNIHRRQIQKWLQCEGVLRASVADALRYDAGQDARPADHTLPRLEPRLAEPASRVFKHDARTLKLVAQKLYPSSFSGAMLKDDRKGEVTQSAPGCFVPKEYQLNDTRSEAMGARPVSFNKLSMDGVARSLILKDSVSGRELCGSRAVSKSPVHKYCPPCPRPEEPRGLTSPRPLSRPRPLFSTPLCSPCSEEPCNLVMSPAVRPCTISPPITQPAGPGTPMAATSPLPARVAEIVADCKTSAFSPKRKWLLDSLQEKLISEPEPLALLAPRRLPEEEPRPKRPCPDFSIARLCGSPMSRLKTEERSAPRPICQPTYATPYPPPIVFPPPLLLPHRTIPELLSLHFKPEPCPPNCTFIKQDPSLTEPVKSEPCPPRVAQVKSEPLIVKEESLSDEEDEPIDVLTMSPLEEKSFDFSGFPGGKRRSFSVQFKLNVLDAFYNDKDCNKNQRATARKFNINRRQVQKWLSLEDELRGEGCAGCPQHCVGAQPCGPKTCLISDLPPPEICRGWPSPSALSVAQSYPCMAWFTPRIY